MIPLAAIPWRSVGLAALAVVLFVSGWGYGARGVQTKWDAERAEQSAAALDASETARREERRRTLAQSEIAHDATVQTEQSHVAAVAAAVAADGLRHRTAELARRCTGNSAAAATSPAASTPGELLADLQRRIDTAAGEFAQYADASHTAGRACERSYDALTP